MRASYVWDKSTNSYPERPSEIIKKDKKLDINITKGYSKNLVIETDLRLSVNFENKIDAAFTLRVIPIPRRGCGVALLIYFERL